MMHLSPSRALFTNGLLDFEFLCLNENDYCCKLRICSGENNGEHLCSTSVRNCQRKAEVPHALKFCLNKFALSWETQVPWKTICDPLFLELLSDSRGAFQQKESEREVKTAAVCSVTSVMSFSYGQYYCKWPNPRILS